MKKLALSSEIYLIRASELKRLPRVSEINSGAAGAFSSAEITVLLKGDTAAVSAGKAEEADTDVLLSGAEIVSAAADGEFLPVRFAYRSYPVWQAFFINLIKPVKRKFYSVFPSTYTTTLSCLLANNITRGERNEQNAYQWTNKKWQISREEAQRRYSDLYNSIKTNGYDAKNPMLVMLNRKFGVKDQLLQGHHRIGICKALNVNEVSISFWAVPRSFGFFKLFTKRKIS